MIALNQQMFGCALIRVPHLSSDSAVSFPSKVCFVRFAELASCHTALHLTNCILVDRALIVVKSKYRKSHNVWMCVESATIFYVHYSISVSRCYFFYSSKFPTPHFLSLTFPPLMLRIHIICMGFLPLPPSLPTLPPPM